MSKQLYEEALADVKKLKEVAEDNAKRALLEAVTPRIRDLIENQLLGENTDDADELLMDEFPGTGDDSAELAPGSSIDDFDDVPLDSSAAPGTNDAIAAAISMPDEEGKVTLDLDSLRTSTGEYELSREAAEKLGVLMSSKKSVVIESNVRSIVQKVKLLRGAGKTIRESKGYSSRLSSVISEVRDMYKHLNENTDNSHKKQLNLKVLKDCYSTLTKLTEQKMKRNRRNLSEAELTLKLTNVPDELEDSLDDIGVDLITEPSDEEGSEEDGEELDLGGDEEGGEEGSEDEEGEIDLDLDGDEEAGESEDEESDSGDEDLDLEGATMESRRLGNNVVVEIDENMLRREIGRMKALREENETKAQSWGNGPGDVSDDFEDDDMGDPFVDIDLTTESQDDDLDEDKDMDQAQVDELDELDQLDMDQAHGEDAEHTETGEQPNDQSNEPGKTAQSYQAESLRRRLRAEVRIQTEAKQKAQKAKQNQRESQKQAKQKQLEAQQKAKQKKTLGSQKAKQEAQQKAKQAKKMQEAYSFYARKFNESVVRSRRLQDMLSEAVRRGNVINGETRKTVAEAADLRAKLAETNLFNAKLLYTNKLLQNESLTKRQKAEVIERLDEARNEREVKLVYESLTKTLRGSSTKQLSESTNYGVIGSSSRPSPRAAASSLNEGFEADRWARLAGIVK